MSEEKIIREKELIIIELKTEITVKKNYCVIWKML